MLRLLSCLGKHFRIFVSGQASIAPHWIGKRATKGASVTFILLQKMNACVGVYWLEKLVSWLRISTFLAFVKLGL